MKINVTHDGQAWVAQCDEPDLAAQGPTRMAAIERLAWLVAIEVEGMPVDWGARPFTPPKGAPSY